MLRIIVRQVHHDVTFESFRGDAEEDCSYGSFTHLGFSGGKNIEKQIDGYSIGHTIIKLIVAWAAGAQRYRGCVQSETEGDVRHACGKTVL